MTTAEYLQQRSNELLDYLGIKPTSSLVIKTLRGEVLALEHQLPKTKEKEFITKQLQERAEIPVVQIERVQFPNNLNGINASDLEEKVKANLIFDYKRTQEYIFETNSGLSFSKEDWKSQCWKKPHSDYPGKVEYLITTRDTRTPDRYLIGYSTHHTEEELKTNQRNYYKYKDINLENIEIETYKIYNSDDPEYKKAKSENLQRYLDDPRNKVDLLSIMKVPELVLVYTNENDKTNELYYGTNMLLDFYKENHDKSGTVFLCTTSDFSNLKDSIQNNEYHKDMDYAKIEKHFFAPELNYYIHECLSNDLGIDKHFLYDDTINNEVKQSYTNYRSYLKEYNLSDISRDLSFINEAIIHNPQTLEILTHKEKQGINWQDLLESPMESPIKYMPKEVITFDLLNKTNYHEPKMIYKRLPSSFSNEQIVNLIDKDLKNVNEIDNNGKKLTALIKALPEEAKNKDLFSELHKKYDKTDLLGELAYSLVVLDLEKNSENAIGALDHFRKFRFMTEYDPVGADDAWGQICGCDYYINKNMPNPAIKFETDLLTVKQWHDIVSQDTRMLEFIPEKIIKDETFWNNYQDFIGKGRYLNHPDNSYRINEFDEYQVFSKMPEHIKTNPDICRDLLEKKAVRISFIDNPKEDHYLLVNPKDYDRIPMDLREKDSFRDLALSAFNIDKWKILDIPEKFITKEMVSEALSYDMELCNRVPLHFLSEELICDKIKNYEHQGAFSGISSSGEHPQCIELELSNHKTVLQYVPEKLKTDRVCQEALKGNPDNAAFLPKLKNIISNSNKISKSPTKNIISNQRKKGHKL